MKRILHLSALLLSAICCKAAVINVSNSPTAPVNAPYTYNNLQTAINAAADNDSLYVHGTNISYGDITITDKTLTFIGAGYGNNLQSNFQQRTRIDNVIFSGFSGTKNIVLMGMIVEANVYNTATSTPVNNLVIERCAINHLGCESNNLIVRQSLFEKSDYNPPFQPTVIGAAIIQNSVFCGGVGGGTSIASSSWENNIFKRSYYCCYPGEISVFNGTAFFKNNIFNQDYGITASNCTFNNNIFYNTGSLTNGNSGTGNKFNTDPGFVNNGNVTSAIGKENYCSAIDYHIAAGGEALTAGPGGTEIGIYGGVNALPATATLNGVPAMPRITEMNLQNISVAPNGTLSVQLKAVKEN